MKTLHRIALFSINFQIELIKQIKMYIVITFAYGFNSILNIDIRNRLFIEQL